MNRSVKVLLGVGWVLLFAAGYLSADSPPPVDEKCYYCNIQSLKFDCTTLGVKTIPGECMLTQTGFPCDFGPAPKKYKCKTRKDSVCRTRVTCLGKCKYATNIGGGGGCIEEGHPGCPLPSY